MGTCGRAPSLSCELTSTPLEGAPQLHDFNPGITQNGLFWTVVLPSDAVQVDLSAGTATLEVHNLHLQDYFTLENALTGNIGATDPRSDVL